MYGVVNGTSTMVAFTLFDFKWLSNFYTKVVNITDAEQLAGLTNSSIDIDFSQLEASDRKGESLYVAGGRVYFETEVFGLQTDTLIGKGFFDKLGYVEPPAPAPSKIGLVLGITIPTIALMAGIGFYIYCKKVEKKKKAMTHID